MKLRGVFRFELAYQLRRPWPWLAAAILLVFAFQNTRVGIVPVTLPQDFVLNSPFIIASVTVISCLIWLLVTPAIAGEAAARDMQTGMHPLLFTAPISRTEYLGGRFLAVFVLNALVLLSVQAGSLLAAYAPGVDPEIIGPFRPAAYLAAYALIALPNAFIAATIQFAVALLSRRSIAAYFGSMVLLFLTVPVPILLYFAAGQKELALLMDPIGMMVIMNEMMTEWTIVEKNARMFALEGAMLRNRLLWIGIAAATLAVLVLRFRFRHDQAMGRVRGSGRPPVEPGASVAPAAVPVSPFAVPRSFGLAIQARQTLSIAGSSFASLVWSLGGLFLLVVFPMFVVLVVVVQSEHWGVPLLPRTGYVVAKFLTAPLTFFADFRVMVPLLVLYFAGELVWRERDAGLGEKMDALPVPEWVVLLGKLLGLALLLTALMATLTAAGMIAQALLGHREFEPGLYLTMLFGLQLPEYLLFAVLVFAVQAVAGHKHIGMLLALLVYLCIVFASFLGIEHPLLVFGSGPEWTFTEMRGFGGSVGPWLWTRGYWAAWALLLAVAARLLWVRGRETGAGARLRTARRRFTRRTAGGTALAAGLVLVLGGFVFYNTNVLNEYLTEDETVRRRAEYERRYGQYEAVPQPTRVATTLHMEIHPERGSATIRGSYRLVNRDSVPIAAVHLEPAFHVDTRVTFDRASTHVLADEVHGHHIHALEEPLQPGDSLTLAFDVRLAPRGFRARPAGLRRSRGTGAGVVRNGTYLTSGVLPVIGYQPRRELTGAVDRRRHGLPRQVTLPTPGDIDPGVAAVAPATFDAVVGTAEDQVAVAPGELRRSWSEGGRRYFHYVSDVPISGEELFFSARYAVHRERWTPPSASPGEAVDIQVFLHPGHTRHLERLLHGVRASLDRFSARYGPYPYRFLQVVEQPGNFLGMGVDGSGVITGGEGFFLLDPQGDGFDVIFEAVAHEVAHQWWGMQLRPAFAEGAGIISESLAWYSAMQLVKEVRGREALRRFMSHMREPDPWPPVRTGLPLLRAVDPWSSYRAGPFALHALGEYVGEDRVDGALRALLETRAGSLATTLDLYRELRAVTPDSLQPLLRDLFEVNAAWRFDTRRATAEPTDAGTWRVSLEVEARKAVVDSAGAEREVPMAEWVEIGVFAPAEPGQILGRPLYVRKHRVRSGRQTITVTVPDRPARGGIDPYNLLDWEEGDNIEEVGIVERAPSGPTAPQARSSSPGARGGAD